MTVLLAELNQRWSAMFAALAAGDDVAPSQRLRIEGMMETAVLLDLVTTDGLLQAMDDAYRGVYGRGVAEDFGKDWQDFFPFPQIPAMGARAPVYPSTSD
jgi:hypothetical protein